MTGPGVSSLCYVTELNFVYQFEPQQSILKALIYKLKSDIDKVNKHVYGSKNENEKMLLKTEERLDQTSRCKRNLKRKHSLMRSVKAVLDVYSGKTKRKDEVTRETYSKLQEDGNFTSSHKIQNQYINTSILVRPYGRETEEENENYNCLAYQLKTQQLIIKDLLNKLKSDTDGADNTSPD